MAVVRSPAQLTALFRERGLRVTPQREAVFRALDASEGHPTAEAVHAAVTADMPMVSLRTVYQTLNDLVEMAEIRQLQLGGGPARFDVTPHAHHHLVCDSCGRVLDLHLDLGDLRVPSAVGLGFTVSSAEVVLRGTCTDCSAARSTPPARREATTR